MPELPEVETIRRDLNRVLKGKRLSKVDVRMAKIIRGNTRAFAARLKGKTVANVARRGKLLIIYFKDADFALLMHLKMTGQLIYVHKHTVLAGGHPIPKLETVPTKHTHLVYHLSDGGVLYFNDLRQFGFAKLVSPGALQIVLDSYGIEPLTRSFTYAHFKEALRRRSTSLKAVLLNQTIIAGLGNIYVDEVCFAARVRPQRKASSLTDAELKKLFRSCETIIRKAIAYRGTTFSKYRDTFGAKGNFVKLLKVYGRVGKPCLRCGTPIRKIALAGRGTTFCPSCQR